MKIKKSIFIPLALLIGSAMPIPKSTPAVAHAEEISISEPIEEDNDLKEKVSTAWETYIVPVIAGISLTTILNVIVSIVTSCVNKKKLADSKEKMDKAIELSSTIITNTVTLINQLRIQNNLSDETKKQFEKSASELITKVSTLTKKTEEMQKIKEVIAILCAIETKLAGLSKEAVKSGVAEEIAKLENNLKQM